MENNKIVTNRELSLIEALVPVVVLMALLAYMVPGWATTLITSYY